MFYPLTFKPIYKERLWGGDALASLYGKRLPANLPIGESWEISDRPGDVSEVANGPLAGQDLHALLQQNHQALLGNVSLVNGRFPLLIKILDAEQTLSLQVHPPARVAPELGGEPKTEMWYLAATQPGAELYVGLRRGVTRELFEEKLRAGGVADCFHRLRVRPGDAMFVPSGRVHGIGAGCVIFEVQQNSDTTYRVFDWNRFGPDGRARELHIPESLASIDFDDFEPSLIDNEFDDRTGEGAVRLLVDSASFLVEARRLVPSAMWEAGGAGACILAMSAGEVEVAHRSVPGKLRAGEFCLVPACLDEAPVRALSAVEFLVIRPK